MCEKKFTEPERNAYVEAISEFAARLVSLGTKGEADYISLHDVEMVAMKLTNAVSDEPSEQAETACVWDESDADIGVWRLTINGDEILRFEKAEKHFRGCGRGYACQYVLAMCIWGSSHSHELEAESVEAAKEECVMWLTGDLKRRIERFRKSTLYLRGLLCAIEGR